MNAKIKRKLAELPANPGVYFFYDQAGEILYIGKASILRRRVSSYFQKQSFRDSKTTQMLTHVADLSFQTTGSELEALFLEAELIKRYKPLYNVRERDDKNFIYIKITAEEFPRVLFVRRPLDDKAKYYGPFLSSFEVRRSLRYLRRIFPYYGESKIARRSSLDHQIGVAPTPGISKARYRQNIRRLVMIIEGRSQQLNRRLERDMKRAAAAHKFEVAQQLRDQLQSLQSLSQKNIFGSSETIDVEVDQALNGLAKTLRLNKIPRRIEAYDVSNFTGGDAVASMIVFTDGLPHQASYKKFKMRTKGPNDFAMMNEALDRRFSDRNAAWPRPDLIIIDGGKGQLSAALDAMASRGVNIPVAGLAKRLEQIVVRRDGELEIIELPLSSKIIKLLQRVRDEAHRFAVSYHTSLRDKRVRTSLLDQIPGVGPVTRKKLLRQFGSVAGVRAASQNELQKAVGVKAKTIREHIK